MTIQSSVFAGIAIQGGFALLIPAGLLIFFRTKYGCRMKPFRIGCLTMLVFALVLEQAAHAAILSMPFGQKIAANPILMALYGGAMAALFEESGRFLAFRWLLKSEKRALNTARMYGAGHGGFEALAVLGLAAISNLTAVLQAKKGDATALVLYNQLAGTPFYLFALAVIERLAAVTAQIGLSVLMAYGVWRDRRWIALAALFHFALDAASVLLQIVLPMLAVEAAVIVMSALIAWTARRVRRKYES